jgi:hypothetical protein
MPRIDKRTKQDNAHDPTAGEILVSTIWLVFYAALAVVVSATPHLQIAMQAVGR